VTSIVDDGNIEALVAQFQEFRPDTVMHLATHYVTKESNADIAKLAESNIAFGMRIAHAFATAGGSSFIYTSTFSQHRNAAAFDPTILYAATKEAFADILRFYANDGQFRVLDLQMFDTFGKGDNRPKIWNLLMNAVDSGVALETTEGQQILCPVHVSDAAAAMASAVELATSSEKSYHEFNVPGPQAVKLRDAVALFEKVNEITIPVVWGARPYSGNEMFELWEHGEPLPGYSPKVSLEEGFRELWQDHTN
jgi:nucleoside-diphosphate-sugar epimerase